jgi:iron complex outermembrane receptor protein
LVQYLLSSAENNNGEEFKMFCNLIKTALTLGAGILVTTSVQGEESGQSTELEEVSVSATRVDKSIEDIPAAVGVVDEEAIQFGTQQLGLDESLVKMPGIFMQNRHNFAQDLRISIRGFGARSSFGIRGIKILVDGIPETLPDGQGSVDSIDLGSSQRIEVIRGPVSSLYGNASGGAILVYSEDAPEIPFISLRPSFGEDGFQKHQIKFGGRSGKLGALLNLSDLNYDGYRDHSKTEARQVNSKFSYDINDDSDVIMVLNHTDSPTADDPGGLTADQVNNDPTQARQRNVDFDSGESVEQTRVGFVYKNKIGTAGSLMLRNYYLWRDFENKLPFVGGGSVAFDRFFVGGGVQYTHTGQIGNFGNRFLIGFDLDQQDDDRERFDNNQGVLGAKTLDQNEKVVSIGVFLQDEIALTERLELTLGGRFDRIRFDVSDDFLADGDDSGKRTLKEFSPSLGIRFGLTDRTNLYANISTSFETPTTTEFANPTGGGFNPDLDPQTATNYEIGIKGLIGARSRYELAVFQIDVDDELVAFEIPTQPGRDFFNNAGKSERKGFEMLLATEPVDGLKASLAYTYSDFTFEKFIDVNANDFGGKTIPGIPEHLVHADLTYAHNSGLFANFDVLYSDKVFTNNANSASSDSYVVSNLKLGYTRFFNNWEFSPFIGVNNLADEHYNGNVRINAFGQRFFEPAPERNIYGGLTLRYDFGA